MPPQPESNPDSMAISPRVPPIFAVSGLSLHWYYDSQDNAVYAHATGSANAWSVWDDLVRLGQTDGQPLASSYVYDLYEWIHSSELQHIVESTRILPIYTGFAETPNGIIGMVLRVRDLLVLSNHPFFLSKPPLGQVCAESDVPILNQAPMEPTEVHRFSQVLTQYFLHPQRFMRVYLGPTLYAQNFPPGLGGPEGDVHRRLNGRMRIRRDGEEKCTKTYNVQGMFVDEKHEAGPFRIASCKVGAGSE